MKIKFSKDGWKVVEINRFAILKGWIKDHWITLVLIFFPTSFLLLIMLVAVLHFFAGIDLPFVEFKNSTSAAYWGQLGDFFGGMLNPILSFAALMSVVYGLNLQRKDLQEARKEASRANYIQNVQTGIYRRQSVEASLLTLITLHLKVVEDMSVVSGVTSGSRVLTGRKAIEQLVENYMRSVARYSREVAALEFSFEKDAYLAALDKLEKLPFNYMLSVGDVASRYMRSIFQVMKFIDSRVDAYDYVDEDVRGHDPKALRRFRMSYVEKRQFSNILRSQLSQDELKLIFLNLLTHEGEGLRYYVEKYSLLKGLDMSFFADHSGLIDKIGKSAFADYEDLHISSIYELEMHHKRGLRRRMFQRKVQS